MRETITKKLLFRKRNKMVETHKSHRVGWLRMAVLGLMKNRDFFDVEEKELLCLFKF